MNNKQLTSSNKAPPVRVSHPTINAARRPLPLGVNLGRRMLNVGCLPVNIEHWLSNVGRWLLNIGCWTFPLGRWLLNVGCRTFPHLGRWKSNVGCWTLPPSLGRWKLNVGCWTFSLLLLSGCLSPSRRPSDVECRMLDVDFPPVHGQ